jgi:superfamily II DNA or RNA helicase
LIPIGRRRRVTHTLRGFLKFYNGKSKRKTTKMIVDRWLKISIPELTPRQWRELEKKLTYEKPNGEIVVSYRRNLSRQWYLIPRGAWNLLPNEIVYEDRRTLPELPALVFVPKLDDTKRDIRFAGQSDAVKAMFREQQGLIVRPPGTGKTQIALAFAAKAKTRTLVLVHTEDILKQWIEYTETAIPALKGKVGVIRGKTCKIGHITIATVQTLNRSYLDKGKEWWAQWGAVISDEGHHDAAPTWEAVLNSCPAFYRFGFTASPTRADGMHPTMRFIVGPIIYRQKFTSSVPLEVVPVRTDFKAMYRGAWDWTPLVTKLVRDVKRNDLIAGIADAEIEEGNSVLVLSRRIEHLEAIAEAMQNDCEILAAKQVTRTERKRILAAFKKGTVRCVLATQLADEALDVPRLNRVLLTHPGKHEGRIIQQIGRALRKFPGKDDAIVYDFIDWRVGVLRRQWDARKRTYRKNKIEIRKEKRPHWRIKLEKVRT